MSSQQHHSWRHGADGLTLKPSAHVHTSRDAQRNLSLAFTFPPHLSVVVLSLSHVSPSLVYLTFHVAAGRREC